MTSILQAGKESIHGTREAAETGMGTSLAAICHTRRAINVLYVIDQLSALGGGERAMIRMIRAHSSRFRCHVLTFREKIHPEAKKHLPVPIHVIPLVRTRSIEGIRAALSIRSLVLSEQIDIVHTFFETSDLFAGLVAKLTGVKVLISSRRDMGILRSRKHQIGYRVMGRLCNRVLTVSEAVRNRVLGEDRVNPDKVTTIYTGIPLPHQEGSTCGLEVIGRIGIPLGAPIVLSVANILPWKGHSDFVEMASLVHEEFPEVHFIVAGAVNDEGLFKELLSLRETLGLRDHVHFLGEVDFVGALYRIATIFCLLSKSEGLPNVVLEAMAAGVPVVATNAGGTAEVVADSETGYLTEVGRPDNAADRICELLRSPYLAQRMSIMARDRVKSLFSLERMMSTLEGVYEFHVGV